MERQACVEGITLYTPCPRKMVCYPRERCESTYVRISETSLAARQASGSCLKVTPGERARLAVSGGFLSGKSREHSLEFRARQSTRAY